MMQPSTDPRIRFSLSQSDVARLLAEPSPETRIEVMHKIASEYETQEFDQQEKLLAEQIFRLLVRDTEVKVRISLAENIKQNNTIPRDIVLSLANDVAEVSLPVIQYSEILSDADLINIINRSGELSRLLAISNRKHVSPMVSSELIETKQPEVVSSLVSNEGASITERGYQTIIDTMGKDETVVEALVQKGGIPIAIIEKLIAKVSDSIGLKLKKKYNLTEAGARQETDRSRELATLKLTEGAVPDAEVETLIAQLQTFGRLTPSIILTSLCRGNLRFFETALATLSNIPTQNAKVLIGDKGHLGFKALYDKSGLPESMFRAAKLVLDVTMELAEDGAVPGGLHYANRVVERIFIHSDGQEIENLSYIIALIRQNGAGQG